MITKGQFRFASELYGKLIKPSGEIIDLGLLSTKYITDDFAKYYIQCLLGNETGIADFKYHDSGTGTTPADESDETLEAPTGMARVTGTQVEGASAIVFQSVATILYDGTYQITEWALFNGLTGNTLMDRGVFAAVPTVLNSEIEFTYNHTALSGG